MALGIFQSFLPENTTGNYHPVWKPIARVHARMPTGGMPTSENCLVRAECRPWLGGMPTGRNADRAQCRIFPLWEIIAILILNSRPTIFISHFCIQRTCVTVLLEVTFSN